MIIHSLKSLPEYFFAVWDGRKTFEIRKNDRNFQIGDYIILQEWKEKENNLYFTDVHPAHHTGGIIIAEITYLSNFEQKEEYVVLGLRIVEKRFVQQEENSPIKKILEDVTWVDKLWITDRT